jgi:hypothetical protein
MTCRKVRQIGFRVRVGAGSLLILPQPGPVRGVISALNGLAPDRTVVLVPPEGSDVVPGRLRMGLGEPSAVRRARRICRRCRRRRCGGGSSGGGPDRRGVVSVPAPVSAPVGRRVPRRRRCRLALESGDARVVERGRRRRGDRDDESRRLRHWIRSYAADGTQIRTSLVALRCAVSQPRCTFNYRRPAVRTVFSIVLRMRNKSCCRAGTSPWLALGMACVGALQRKHEFVKIITANARRGRLTTHRVMWPSTRPTPEHRF